MCESLTQIVINISGGNNRILPNATHIELHFHYHGVEPSLAVKSKSEETANDKDRTCRTATEVGEVVAAICDSPSGNEDILQ